MIKKQVKLYNFPKISPRFYQIELDIDEYRKKYDNKAIKKTLTIPNWLNTKAEANNLNFSKILQNALKKELHIDI